MRVVRGEGFPVFIPFFVAVLAAVPAFAGITGGISTMSGAQVTSIHNHTASGPVTGAETSPRTFSIGGSCPVSGNTSIGFAHEESRTVMVGGGLFVYKVNAFNVTQQVMGGVLALGFGVGHMTTVAAGAPGRSGLVGDFIVAVPVYLLPSLQVVLTNRTIMVNGGRSTNVVMMGLSAVQLGNPAKASKAEAVEAPAEDAPAAAPAPAQKPAKKPAKKAVKKAVEKPVEQPAEQPAEKPAEQPAEQP
jgi:hypothetical protein